MAAENLDFPDDSFDVVTACQCFWYFDHAKLEPELVRMLKPGGRILLLYMAWLPQEDRIAGAGALYQRKLAWQDEDMPGNRRVADRAGNFILGAGTYQTAFRNCSRCVYGAALWGGGGAFGCQIVMTENPPQTE